jgi:aminopeptidase N
VRNWTACTALILVTAISVGGQSRRQQQVQDANNSVIAKASEARSVVGQAKVAALNIKNDSQRGLVLDEIGAAEAKAGDLNAAVETANRAYPNTMATLTAIGEQLGNSNDFVKAQSKELSDFETKLMILNITAAMIDNGEFEAASPLLTMRPNSVADVQRGTAVRTIALLQTKKSGGASSQPWALALTDTEDRAYALLGIAQALLEIDDVKLPYSAIQIH